jgi:hypothetical protein
MYHSRLLVAAAVAATTILASCKPPPPPPPPGPAFATSGTLQIGVVYTPPSTTSLAKWTYYVSDSTGFDRIAITLSKPCKAPTSTSGATVSPPSGDTANSALAYPVTVTSDKITILCDAEAGGVATFKVLSVSSTGTTVAGAITLSVLGPK